MAFTSAKILHELLLSLLLKEKSTQKESKTFKAFTSPKILHELLLSLLHKEKSTQKEITTLEAC